MDDLVTWLRAQIDEDERAARDAEDQHPSPWRDDEGTVDDATGQNIVDWTPISGYLIGHDPARVLREVEAKRGTVDWCVEVVGDRDLSRYGEFGTLKDDPDALAVTPSRRTGSTSRACAPGRSSATRACCTTSRASRSARVSAGGRPSSWSSSGTRPKTRRRPDARNPRTLRRPLPGGRLRRRPRRHHRGCAARADPRQRRPAAG